jgi:DNA adenine methylase
MMTAESTLNCVPDFENIKVGPILKWAGGKQQLLQHLLSRVPQNFHQYIEPFVGGGALFFTLNPGKAIISDSNPELINVYNMAAHHVEELIKILKILQVSKNTFYEIRDQDTSKLSNIEKAARTIYLNRTCFNGLYRVNKKGQFNVPFGKHKNPKVCYPGELRAA